MLIVVVWAEIPEEIGQTFWHQEPQGNRAAMPEQHGAQRVRQLQAPFAAGLTPPQDGANEEDNVRQVNEVVRLLHREVPASQMNCAAAGDDDRDCRPGESERQVVERLLE